MYILYVYIIYTSNICIYYIYINRWIDMYVYIYIYIRVDRLQKKISTHKRKMKTSASKCALKEMKTSIRSCLSCSAATCSGVCPCRFSRFTDAPEINSNYASARTRQRLYSSVSVPYRRMH